MGLGRLRVGLVLVQHDSPPVEAERLQWPFPLPLFLLLAHTLLLPLNQPPQELLIHHDSILLLVNCRCILLLVLLLHFRLRFRLTLVHGRGPRANRTAAPSDGRATVDRVCGVWVVNVDCWVGLGDLWGRHGVGDGVGDGRRGRGRGAGIKRGQGGAGLVMRSVDELERKRRDGSNGGDGQDGREELHFDWWWLI
ncbi:hypothetical protein BDZ91DRAFT_731586 [Kalaharituber pfeilii]|nr:hypothetical protein BDZ91DRAFT_731586 [Kalaharituber pfeilii]